MTPMLEKLARALCAKAYEHIRGMDPRDLFDGDRDHWIGLARAVLMALREPDEGMLDAVWQNTARATADERMAMELMDNKTAFKLKAARRHRAMIDHILNGDTNA